LDFQEAQALRLCDNESDRQVAIADIARCLQPSLNFKYVAGVWDYQVEFQLVWTTIDIWRKFGKTSTSKSLSWSWASSPSIVCYITSVSDIDRYLRPDLFKVLSIKAKPKDEFEDDDSLAESGYLRVLGKLTPVIVNHVPRESLARRDEVYIRQGVLEFLLDRPYIPGNTTAPRCSTM
jgi:hypothetical protein